MLCTSFATFSNKERFSFLKFLSLVKSHANSSRWTRHSKSKSWHAHSNLAFDNLCQSMSSKPTATLEWSSNWIPIKIDRRRPEQCRDISSKNAAREHHTWHTVVQLGASWTPLTAGLRKLDKAKQIATTRAASKPVRPPAPIPAADSPFVTFEVAQRQLKLPPSQSKELYPLSWFMGFHHLSQRFQLFHQYQ